MNKPLAEAYVVVALALPFAVRVIRQPQEYPRVRLAMMRVVDLLVLRPFFQRWGILTGLALPIVAWGFRGWLVFSMFDRLVGAGFALLLSALLGFMFAYLGWRIQLAWLVDRKLAQVVDHMRNKPR